MFIVTLRVRVCYTPTRHAASNKCMGMAVTGVTNTLDPGIGATKVFDHFLNIVTGPGVFLRCGFYGAEEFLP